MTGFYLRIKRDGKMQYIEIDQLTDEELDELERKSRDTPDGLHADRGWTWVRGLVKWIRDKVTEAEPAERDKALHALRTAWRAEADELDESYSRSGGVPIMHSMTVRASTLEECAELLDEILQPKEDH